MSDTPSASSDKLNNRKPHTGPTLPTLSPAALAALRLPMQARHGEIFSAIGQNIGGICSPHTTAEVDDEIAVFTAALLTAALTPEWTAEEILKREG